MDGPSSSLERGGRLHAFLPHTVSLQAAGLCITEGHTEAGWEGQGRESFVSGIKFTGAPEKKEEPLRHHLFYHMFPS